MKFLMILNEILKGKKLNMPPTQQYVMTNNLLNREALWLFGQKYQEKGNPTTENYELVIQCLMTHFLLQKDLQR